jgi:hypothetical protein
MNLNRHRYRGPLVAALAPLLLAAPAQAASLIQSAVVHATACHAVGDASDNFFYNSNGMGNKSKTAILYVTCPVPFDVPFDTGDVKLGAGGSSCTANSDNRPWVEVYNRSSIQNVSCTLFIKNSDGLTEAAFTANTLSPAVGIQRLVFNLSGAPVGTGRNLMINCRIPPLAGDFSFVANMGVTTCAVTP